MNALELTDDELDVVKSVLNAMKRNIEMVLNESIFLNSAESDIVTLQTALRLAENVVEKIDNIDKAPIIDAESIRYAHWVKSTIRGQDSIYCSACLSENQSILPSNYCHNCGANMCGDDI